MLLFYSKVKNFLFLFIVGTSVHLQSDSQKIVKPIVSLCASKNSAYSSESMKAWNLSVYATIPSHTLGGHFSSSFAVFLELSRLVKDVGESSPCCHFYTASSARPARRESFLTSLTGCLYSRIVSK